MSTSQNTPDDSTSSPAPFRVLHVEDNAADARLVEVLLSEVEGERYEIEHLGRLSLAKTRMLSKDGEQKLDVILLDLGLPDSQGLATLSGILPMAGGVPIVVLTGLNDDTEGRNAVARGAEDYLRKSDVGSPELLARTLQYAISRRQRVLANTVAPAVVEPDENSALLDRRWFDGIAGDSSTTRFRDKNQDLFDELVQRYLPMLTVKNRLPSSNVLSDKADAILEQLANANAQPSDLVDLHSTALRLSLDQSTGSQKELRDHARFVSLTMMARLAALYRKPL